MQPEKSFRMDTSELKAQLFKKVGPERFKRYFFCLNRFINQKLSKSDFDKSCYRLLGRENLPLHNQIIKAILKNSFSAKTPPPHPIEADPTKLASTTGRSPPVQDDVYGQVSALPHNNQGSVGPPIWSNGVSLPMSPRKLTGIRERKFKDRPSPLGPNGRTDFASYQSNGTKDSGGKTMENGVLYDYQRPFQHPRGLAEQPQNEGRLMIKKKADIRGFVQGKHENDVAFVEGGEEVEQDSQLKFPKSPLIAPLGIPFCSASTGGARKALPMSLVGDYVSFFDSAHLSDTETLRRRMEQITEAQGLGGVTLHCANTLNNMVDVYLKRLIKSCVELVGAGSKNDTSRYPIQKQQSQGRLVNGLWPSNHFHTQSGGVGGPIEEQRAPHSVSLLDFKVAMELNPQQLGEDWPSLLEKISMHACEK